MSLVPSPPPPLVDIWFGTVPLASAGWASGGCERSEALHRAACAASGPVHSRAVPRAAGGQQQPLDQAVMLLRGSQRHAAAADTSSTSRSQRHRQRTACRSWPSHARCTASASCAARRIRGAAASAMRHGTAAEADQGESCVVLAIMLALLCTCGRGCRRGHASHTTAAVRTALLAA